MMMWQFDSYTHTWTCRRIISICNNCSRPDWRLKIMEKTNFPFLFKFEICFCRLHLCCSFHINSLSHTRLFPLKIVFGVYDVCALLFRTAILLNSGWCVCHVHTLTQPYSIRLNWFCYFRFFLQISRWLLKNIETEKNGFALFIESSSFNVKCIFRPHLGSKI